MRRFRQAQGIDGVAGGFELAVDVAHLDMAGVPGLATRQQNQSGGDGENRRHDGDGFGEKQRVVRGETVHRAIVRRQKEEAVRMMRGVIFMAG